MINSLSANHAYLSANAPFWQNLLDESASLLICCVFVMQGQHLQRGSRLVDFVIKLGDAECVPVSLTDDQVDCEPPTVRPGININNTFCHDHTVSLSVSVIFISRSYCYTVWSAIGSSLLSVCLSVCDAVHSGSRGWCTRLKVAPARS